MNESASSILPLPIYVVDDELEGLSWVGLLRQAVPDATIEGFTSLEEAEAALLDVKEPFLLVMDYDFEKSPRDGFRKGDDLIDVLRVNHRYGPMLPILMFSGRMDDVDSSAMARQHTWKYATAFAHKDLLSLGKGIPDDFSPAFGEVTLGRKLDDRHLYLLSLLHELQESFVELSVVESARHLRLSNEAREALLADDDLWGEFEAEESE